MRIEQEPHLLSDFSLILKLRLIIILLIILILINWLINNKINNININNKIIKLINNKLTRSNKKITKNILSYSTQYYRFIFTITDYVIEQNNCSLAIIPSRRIQKFCCQITYLRRYSAIKNNRNLECKYRFYKKKALKFELKIKIKFKLPIG